LKQNHKTKAGKWLSTLVAAVIAMQGLLPQAPAFAAEPATSSAPLYKEVSAGDESVTVLHSIGAVWVWGNNPLNSYDSYYTTFAPAPLRKADGSQLAGIVDIASGSYHSLALASNGTVWAWGRNDNGQLGKVLPTASSHVPVQVDLTGMAGQVVKVDAGSLFSVAVTDTGYVYAWGFNGDGQIGNGNYTQAATPQRVVDEYDLPLAGVIDVQAGWDFVLALTADETSRRVYAWGG
jgi:alpha-tubulin suppressor-like RCC1 family protein